MIKAIIFDFDLTLSNRQYSIYQCFKRMVEKYFGDLDWMEKEAIIQRMMLYDEFGTVSKLHIAEMMAKKYDLDLEKLKADCLNLSIEMAPFTIVDEDAIEVLNTLKKHYKLGMITNGIYESQTIKLETAQIKDYFDDIIIAGEINLWKPDPKVFEMAADRLGVKVEECLYIGDVFFNDILGAYRANMHYLLINNHRRWYYDPKIPYINHLKDLIPYLKEHYDNTI